MLTEYDRCLKKPREYNSQNIVIIATKMSIAVHYV